MILKPIADNFRLLSKSEQDVANYFLENINAALQKSGEEIGIITGTSAATVSRFARKIGFKNLADAKVGLAKVLSHSSSISNVPPSEADMFISEDDDLTSCGRKLFSQIHDVCSNALAMMDTNLLGKAVAKIMCARSVRIAGVGASGVAAQSFAMKLTNIGIQTNYIIDPHINLKSMMSTGKEDVLVAFSYTGSLAITLKTCDLAKSKGCYIISICGNTNSPIAKLSDIVLQSPATEQVTRVGAVGSHYSQQFVSDMLFLGLVTADYKTAKEAVNLGTRYMEGWR